MTQKYPPRSTGQFLQLKCRLDLDLSQTIENMLQMTQRYQT